jgi:hypothetical protein
MNEHLLQVAFRIWLIEIAVSAFNYFVLMNRVYEPKFGELRAHRIGMATRIAYIFAFAGLFVAIEGTVSTLGLIAVGGFWLALTLAFEWGGSLIIRRPVKEILIGWNINRGYMWPYVLAAYLLSPLIVGSIANAIP